MAKTIPQLTDATTVNAADELIIHQGGVTKRATATELFSGTATVTSTGSTTGRSLKDRFADVINVKDFGAVGDGVADDTTAIQAAINAAAAAQGGTVVLPKGKYKITSTLTITNGGIALVGNEGAVLVQHTDNTTFLRIGDGTLQTRPGVVRVERLTFSLKSNATTWTSAYAIDVDFAFFVHFEHLDIYGFDQSDFTTPRLINGIRLRKVQRFKAYRCFIRGLVSGGHCVYTIGESGGINWCIDVTFEHCYFDSFAGHGFYFDNFTQGTFLFNQLLVSSSCTSLITYDCGATENANHFVYGLNCEGSGTSNGIVFNSGTLFQFADGWMSCGAGNKIIDINTNAQNVQIAGLWTTEGRWEIDAANVIVSGCYIGSIDNDNAYALTVSGDQFSISNSQIDQFQGGGINLVGEPDRVLISGIRFVAVSGTLINGAGYVGGPSIEGVSSVWQISGNHFVTAASTMTFPYGREWWTITGSTPIANITAQHPGRRLYLQAASGGFTFGTGGNIQVNNTTVTSNQLVELVSEGTFWFEVGRKN